jgi:hypothetical protein
LEAIGILYTANTFSLKGTRGVTAFKSITPLLQWQMIRHMHISTLFLAPKDYMPAHKHFPPENFSQWPDTCRTLNKMQGLRSLRIEIIVWDFYRKGSAFVDNMSLGHVLEPLNQITVPFFEVEMNLPIPDVVLERLGQLAFIFVERERPVNRILLDLSY